MSSVSKAKYVKREVIEEQNVCPDESRFIVQLLASRGNNLHLVRTSDGSEFLASMPAKFRKSVWVKRGDYLLCEKIVEGDRVKAEILHVLLEDNIKEIEEKGLWPQNFLTVCDNNKYQEEGETEFPTTSDESSSNGDSSDNDGEIIDSDSGGGIRQNVKSVVKTTSVNKGNKMINKSLSTIEKSLPVANFDQVLLEGTVPTGFEFSAAKEIKEKLNVKSICRRGRVFFAVSIDKVEEALKLRSLDNLYAIVLHRVDVEFGLDLEGSQRALKLLVDEVDWVKGLTVWQKSYGILPGGLDNSLYWLQNLHASSDSTAAAAVDAGDDVANIPVFRVTCYRTGDSHSFSSMQAAACFGGQINDLFHWRVDMHKFDIHLVLNINRSEVYVGLALTQHSLHHRGIVNFGPTTLRATICYGMLKLCNLVSGEVVCDPMCGSGAIPVEAAFNWPSCVLLAGDCHPQALLNSSSNIRHADSSNRVHLFEWDATSLPLRDACLDCIVCDLPFGKRMGRRADNRILYPSLLREWARVVRQGCGRAVLLSQDKRSVLNAVRANGLFWKHQHTTHVNVGGLDAFVYLLKRIDKVNVADG